jgi:hypothetical protein
MRELHRLDRRGSYEGNGSRIEKRPAGSGSSRSAGYNIRIFAIDRSLHTMIRVCDLNKCVAFYTSLLGMKELRRHEVPAGKCTLSFVGYDSNPDQVEIVFVDNWEQD